VLPEADATRTRSPRIRALVTLLDVDAQDHLRCASETEGLLRHLPRVQRMGDVSDVSTLTNPYWLYLNDNQISDLGPLSGLTSLQYLNLSDNQITDVTPLVPLTKLSDLDLSSNPLSCSDATLASLIGTLGDTAVTTTCP